MNQFQENSDIDTNNDTEAEAFVTHLQPLLKAIDNALNSVSSVSMANYTRMDVYSALLYYLLVSEAGDLEEEAKERLIKESNVISRIVGEVSMQTAQQHKFLLGSVVNGSARALLMILQYANKLPMQPQ